MKITKFLPLESRGTLYNSVPTNLFTTYMYPKWHRPRKSSKFEDEGEEPQISRPQVPSLIEVTLYMVYLTFYTIYIGHLK